MARFSIPFYTAQDCDLSLIQGRRVAVIGYGSQGRAQALNLRGSGVSVCIGLRVESASRADAAADGMPIRTPEEASRDADVTALLTPDETQADVYQEIIKTIKPGAALVFAHGLAIHYTLIKPRGDLDVILAAPKAIGPAVRSEYEAGRGVPGLIAVHQDHSGNAKALALSFMAALGCARAGIFETTFQQECEADLFSEQAVLCSAIPGLIRTGFETLVEAGFPPEIAYFECLHEAKLVVDLIYARGIAGMRDMISNTAEYGAYRGDQKLITPAMKDTMKAILADVQSGAFVREYLGGNKEGLSRLPALRAKAARHAIEDAGDQLRALIFKEQKK